MINSIKCAATVLPQAARIQVFLAWQRCEFSLHRAPLADIPASQHPEAIVIARDSIHVIRGQSITHGVCREAAVTIVGNAAAFRSGPEVAVGSAYHIAEAIASDSLGVAFVIGR